MTCPKPWSTLFQVSHKLFWTRYFFKVHLIEKQEQKRQALRRRAEQVRVDSDSAMNWDDVADLAGGDGSKKEDDDIPAEVQDKLLSDYERELIAEKLKKGEAAASSSSKEAATALSDEIAEMALKEEEESKREERNSPESKGELSLY